MDSAPAATATSAPRRTPPPKPSAPRPQKKPANSTPSSEALEGTSRSTGKLHTELSTGALRNTEAANRKIFDTLLDALVRAGLIALTTEQWTNPEGNLITFKKAALTHEGRMFSGPLPPDLLIKDSSANTPTSSKRKKTSTTSSPKPSKANLKTEREQATASYTSEQKSLEANLRAWRKAEAAKTGKPAFIVFSDTVLQNLVVAAPKNLTEFRTISGIGPDKIDHYGSEIIALCRNVAPPLSTPLARRKESSSRPKRSEVERPPHFAEATRTTTSATVVASRYRKASALGLSGGVENGASALGVRSHSAETFTRPRTTSEPIETLTPVQQTLDTRLREWRQTESEKLNLPLFFVLASTTLRSIVLAHPQSLSQLKSIHGLTHEKIEKFGPGILEICTA